MICTLSSIYKLHFTQNLISQFDEYENSAKMMLPNTDYSDALKPAKKNCEEKEMQCQVSLKLKIIDSYLPVIDS